MKRSILILFASFLLLAGCSNTENSILGAQNTEAPGASDPIDENDADYQALLSPDFFAYGPVGYSGMLPDEIASLKCLLEKPNARLYFSALEQKADNEGKLYALCGLYHTDFELYKSLVESYAQNDESAKLMSGCIIYDQPIAPIIVDGFTPALFKKVIPDMILQVR